MKNMKYMKNHNTPNKMYYMFFSCISCISLLNKSSSPRHNRSGTILVFMLVVTATLTALALFAGVAASNRARLASDSVLRSALRDEAFDAIAQVAALINADTNGVDHLSEPWAQPMRFGRVEVFVTDEKTRLHFPTASPRALASLLNDDDVVAALVAWRDSETNRVWRAEEELLAFPFPPTAKKNDLRPLLPFLTAHGDVRVNVNTLPREVFVALAVSAGASAETAVNFHKRLEEARKRGDFFNALTPDETARVLSDGHSAPTTAELAILRALIPALCVESGLFRITARASDGAVSQSIQCVYERGTSRISRWVEL